MTADQQSRGVRMAGKRFGLQPSPGGPTPGSTEHALFVLVILEVLALVALRRYFRSAHGG